MLIFKTIMVATIIGFSRECFSQEKRISKNQVPKEIINFIDTNYPNHQTIKFYKSTSNDSVFIESDFKLKNDEYSLSFLNSGKIIEIEKEIEKKIENEQVK